MSNSRFKLNKPSLWRALLLSLLVAGLNFALWAVVNRPVQVPDWTGKIKGMAVNWFQRYQSPIKHIYADEADIESDIKLLSQYTSHLRTYTSTEAPSVPRLAAKYGMTVLAGAWLDRRAENSELELQAMIDSARQNKNIDRVIVGNETLLRQDLSPNELIGYLDRARAALKQPVSTAEPVGIWLRNPKLVKHVDFITVHLLPYWNGVIRRDALGLSVLKDYNDLRARYPDKHILIGEIGWPSNGDRHEYAQPSIADEAQFLREWFYTADLYNLDYFIEEAFDQPWKEAGEGRVGAYWGMFNSDRQPKFPLTGTVVEDPQWPWKALIGSLLGLGPMFWFARHFMRFKPAGILFYLILLQLSASLLVWSAMVPYAFYLSPFDWTMLIVLFPAQIAIVMILLINGFEFTEVLWRPRWMRQFGLLNPLPGDPQPFVSIHLACCNEPPEMVILTLDSLAALEYDNFEVLVLDNNTKEESVWRPVEEHCAKLGAKFRFFHLSPWPGFKAGALNFGLTETDPRAEAVAVIDADYVVRPDWLRALTGYFANPKVALVQCPQAHRDWEHNAFRRMTNWEYDGFFRIGMHHRNERNAIIMHGTMTMVRRSALQDTGGWSEWTICEDAELGLRLMHAGYDTLYVDEIMGRGLTPADFTAYKSQRYRWAFGAMQVLKARWNWMTTKGPLDAGQRFHFLTGWFSWFADALHLVFTMLALVWTAGMIGLPQVFSLPLDLFLIPLLGFFAFKAAFGVILYRVRVPCSWRDTLSASIASMALSHAIARGIFLGLWKKHGEFVRTAKSRRLHGRPNPFTAVREELLMFVAIGLGIFGMWHAVGINYIEGKLWIAILAAQAIPYASAMIGAVVAGRSGEKSG
ncbi:glycosyltransferase family 2 protein [Pseudolysobacter antarcticus]|uniref:glycosyltransferase family 2 protein n=1 Tax=Pseudolysobacter antarcticus TaxID=2511995 RepID=UPI001F5C28FD|nr:glycosyltransferase family 2 protein [Pseudolysobacter antarcticus]